MKKIKNRVIKVTRLKSFPFYLLSQNSISLKQYNNHPRISYATT